MKGAFKISVALVLLGLLGCEKKRYPDTVIENEAIFYFDGTLDGVRKKIVAGEDNYYMYASHANNGKLLQFTANLKRTDCGTCSGLRLQLNDNHLSEPGSALSDSSLTEASYSYGKENSNDYLVNFTPLFNRDAQGYLWDFGDGGLSSEATPTHKYAGPGKYKVCLTIASSAGCYSQICNEIELGDNAIRTQIKATLQGGNTILFSNDFVIGAKHPIHYYWSFGDGTTSTSASTIHTYAVNGSYPVMLIITDADGKTTTANYNVITGNDASSCAANFKLGNVSPVPSEGLMETDIKWTDDQGREYHSTKVDQPSDSYFEVEKVEEFERNENNQPTKKLNVRFSCVVSDGTRNIKIQDAKAVISVSYP